MKALERAYDLTLAALLVITPLAFGAVHIWAFSLAEILSFSLLAIWAVKVMLDPGFAFDRRLLPLAVAAALFISFVLSTLIPMPRG
ncbi:hypothetical protein LCGC14_1534780, partial [marine sediment metagenome]